MNHRLLTVALVLVIITQFGYIGMAKEHDLSSNITDNKDSKELSEISIDSPRSKEIRVIIEFNDLKESHINKLKDKGAKIETKYGNKIQARIPSDSLKEYEGINEVKRIREPISGHPTEVISEGVGVMNADELHEKGIEGEGIKVGVLATTGFNISNSEISSNIEGYKNFTNDGIDNNGNNAHGTGVAEIVIDMAPSSDLYLANFDYGVEYANAADWLVNNDVDVIVMSVAFFLSPNNGNGYISEVADDAVKDGVVWVNSAGNYAENHWQGNFSDPDSDDWLNFNETHEINYLQNGGEISAGTRFYISLTWDWDNWENNDQDYNLYIVNSTGDPVAGSVSVQDGDDYPRESISYKVQEDGYYGVAIEKYNATGDQELELFFPNYGYPTFKVRESSITAPASADNVTSIGAYNYDDGALTSYSSWGPTNDGRLGLDMMGPTKVTTTAYDGPFTGTSASAPHIAGMAGLLLSMDSSLSPNEVDDLLKESSIDMRAEGPDYATGYGKLDGIELLNNVNDPPKANFTYKPKDIFINQTITFNASVSYDPDGSISSFEWSFGDGSGSSGEDSSHSYSEEGNFSVELTVTDDLGSTDTSQEVVTVQEEDQSPVANFTYTPENPVINETIQFNSTSYDSDGSISSFEWSFGDGSTSKQENPTHTYESGGSYTVELTVTDDSGATDTTHKTITVQEKEISISAQRNIPKKEIFPGGSFDVTVDVTTGNATGLILEENLPNNWNITQQTSNEASFGGTNIWLWFNPSDTDTVSYTVKLPENAAEKTYTITGELKTDTKTTTVTGNKEITITDGIQKTIEEAISGEDGEVGDIDILDAIDYWSNGEEVPDTGGETIDDVTILELIDIWSTS